MARNNKDWSAKPNFYERHRANNPPDGPTMAEQFARYREELLNALPGGEKDRWLHGNFDFTDRNLAVEFHASVGIFREIDPFDETREWALEMNSHFEGHEIPNAIAVPLRPDRKIILLHNITTVEQLTDLIRNVVDVTSEIYNPRNARMIGRNESIIEELGIYFMMATDPEGLFHDDLLYARERTEMSTMRYVGRLGGHNPPDEMPTFMTQRYAPQILGVRINLASKSEFNELLIASDEYR